MTRILIAAIVVTLSPAQDTAQQQEWAFPHTRSNGRATPEYQHEGLHVVANYDYSQRNHKAKWLLLDLAAASRKPVILHKGDVTLVQPDGRTLPVAPQQEILGDAPGISQLLQNARIWRRPLHPYFIQREGFEDAIRFQAFPPGSGITSDEVVVKDDGITIGPVLFRAPAGRWVAGTYRLQVHTEVGDASLPIRLE